MPMVPNRPTPKGIALGRELARLADVAEEQQLKEFPNMKPRCKSCAFRSGTFPNGCEATLMDAMKCVLEQTPFYCHEKPAGEDATELCGGWVVSLATDMPAVKVPWEFSHIIDAEDFPDAH